MIDRRLRGRGLALCRRCFNTVVLPQVLASDRAVLLDALDEVRTSGGRVPWERRGGWRIRLRVEEKRWTLDLHDLNGDLARDAVEALSPILPQLRLGRFRAIVGKSGRGVLRRAAQHGFQGNPTGATPVRGKGWVDLTWGDGPEAAVRQARTEFRMG